MKTQVAGAMSNNSHGSPWAKRLINHPAANKYADMMSTSPSIRINAIQAGASPKMTTEM